MRLKNRYISLVKTIQKTIIFLLPYLGFCQFTTPELYGEYNLFIDEEFDSNVYHKITFGTQLTSFKYIAPEVDVSYYFGINTEDIYYAEETGTATYKAYLTQFFEGFVWGLAPKLFYEEEGTKVVLIPKYHFGKVRAEGDFLDSDDLSIQQEIKTKIYYWSFALGIEESKWSNNATYGFYLIYSGFNAGKVLNQLDFKNQKFQKDNFNTRTVGLGMRISYSFKRDKKPT